MTLSKFAVFCCALNNTLPIWPVVLVVSRIASNYNVIGQGLWEIGADGALVTIALGLAGTMIFGHWVSTTAASPIRADSYVLDHASENMATVPFLFVGLLDARRLYKNVSDDSHMFWLFAKQPRDPNGPDTMIRYEWQPYRSAVRLTDRVWWEV